MVYIITSCQDLLLLAYKIGVFCLCEQISFELPFPFALLYPSATNLDNLSKLFELAIVYTLIIYHTKDGYVQSILM